MTLPPFLAVIPLPLLIAVPVIGLGAVLWYELIYKKTPTAGSLAAPVSAPPPAPPVMDAIYTPPPSPSSPAHVAPLARATIPMGVLRAARPGLSTSAIDAIAVATVARAPPTSGQCPPGFAKGALGMCWPTAHRR